MDAHFRRDHGAAEMVATAAGCASYTVYLVGKQVRYFGRDGVSRSVVKSADINAPVYRAFDFLANPMNWSQ